jgi:hypothetical protein
MWLATLESGAEHDVGLPAEEWCDNDRVLVRIVFEVSVLNDHEWFRCGGESSSEGCTLSPVLRLGQHCQAVVIDRSQQVECRVSRAVVDCDDFADKRRHEDKTEDLLDRCLLVEARDDNREAAVGRNDGFVHDRRPYRVRAETKPLAAAPGVAFFRSAVGTGEFVCRTDSMTDTPNHSATEAANEWHQTACILCSINCGVEVKLDGPHFARVRGD